MGGSEYLSVIFDRVAGNAPSFDLDFEKRLQEFLLEAIYIGIIRSAHYTSEGGLAVTLAECCIINREKKIGASIRLDINSRADFALFGEDQSRIIVTCRNSDRDELEELALMREIPCHFLGETGGDYLTVNDLISMSVDGLAEIYYYAIPKLMET